MRKIYKNIINEPFKHAYVIRAVENSIDGFELIESECTTDSYVAIWNEDAMITLFGEYTWCESHFIRNYGKFDFCDLNEKPCLLHY